MDTAKVGRGLIKQEITIADATDTALLTLWQTDVGKLENSYQFNRLIVCTYHGQSPTIPSCQCGANIDSISEVADESFLLDNDTLLEGTQVMGVCAFTLACNARKGLRSTYTKKMYVRSDIARLNIKKQT